MCDETSGGVIGWRQLDRQEWPCEVGVLCLVASLMYCDKMWATVAEDQRADA